MTSRKKLVACDLEAFDFNIRETNRVRNFYKSNIMTIFHQVFLLFELFSMLRAL